MREDEEEGVEEGREGCESTGRPASAGRGERGHPKRNVKEACADSGDSR